MRGWRGTRASRTASHHASFRSDRSLPFPIFDMGEPLKLDYFWAGLCLMGAVYFIFR